MPDRIPLDHLTSDQYEQLCAQRDQMARDLAALREVARSYCPHCGRGDASPTTQQWEEQKQRADQAEAKVVDYENRITWHTTCQACARVLDSSIRETERRERAEAAIAHVRGLHREWDADPGHCAHCQDGMGTPLPWPCPTIQALDGDQSAPAKPREFRPYQPADIPRTGNPDHTLVVEPYRNDWREHVWAFRCWGTPTCDGWLSLDHHSQQSAEQARDRHVAEQHSEPAAPAATQTTDTPKEA